jgi:hypothetical protein
VVLEELKFATLGKYSGLLIEGSILKVKAQIACYAISVCDLCPVANGNRRTFFCPQNKETVQKSFLVAHSYEIRRKSAGPKQRREGYN